MKSLVQGGLGVPSRRARADLRALAPAAFLICGLFTVWAGPMAAPVAAAHGKSGPLTPRLQLLADPAFESASALAQAQALFLPVSGPGSITARPGGRILVDIRVGDTGAATLDSLKAAGALPVYVDDALRIVTADVAPDRLNALAAVQPQVISVEEVLQPQTNAACPSGNFISEGDTQLKAASARGRFSVDGSGIVVGVLSDSYDNLGTAAADVSNGELPGAANPCGFTSPVTVQEEGVAGADEGRAMSQIIHDLAPGAEIRFATANLGEQDFANQIRALAAGGADIIVDDFTYFAEPMYQDGVIAKAVEDVTAQGVTYFSSAANDNAVLGGIDVASYEAPAFRPTACPATVAARYSPHAVTCHDFDPGAGVDNTYGFTYASSARYILGWNEPQFGITTDLELCAINHSDGVMIGCSEDNNLTTQKAYENLGLSGSGTVDYVVVRYSATGTPRLKLISLRSNLSAVEYPTGSGGDVVGPSIFGHNASRSGATVAAIPYDDAATIEPFSSRGPATYCYGPVVGTTPATPLPSCVTAPVDMSATDGTATSFFGQGTSPHRFYGTSAAAPHAAAIAALMLQWRPCLTAAQVIAAMKSTAVPVGAFGTSAMGAGRLDAAAALGAARCSLDHLSLSPSSASITAGGSVAYTAQGRDVYNGVTGTVTGSTSLEIAGGGSCNNTTHTCTSTVLGDHVVTGTYGTAKGTATLHVITVPGAPTVVSAAIGNGSALVSWHAPASTGGSAITKYTATSSPGSLACAWTSGPLTCTVPGLTPGLKYTFTVKALNAAGWGIPSTASSAITAVKGSTFHPLTPVRVLDTRTNPANGYSGKLVAGTPISFQVTGRADKTPTIPAGATAVTGNLTVTDASAPGSVYLGPTSQNPGLPTIDFKAGQTIANGVTIGLSPSGKLFATLSGGAGSTTNLVFDVTGYFALDTTGYTYHPIDPIREVDTRISRGVTHKIVVNTPTCFAVAGANGLSGGAKAVTGSVTVVTPSASWALYLGPVNTTTPPTSTINFLAGETVSNSLSAALDSSGRLCATYLGPAGASMDLVFDVTGYYTADLTGTSFVPVGTFQIVNTTSGIGIGGKIATGTIKTFGVAGHSSISTIATGVTGNVTAFNETAGWAIYLGPVGLTAPATSTLNFAVGEKRANGFTVALSSTGTMAATYLGPTTPTHATTDLWVDITGYFLK